MPELACHLRRWAVDTDTSQGVFVYNNTYGTDCTKPSTTQLFDLHTVTASRADMRIVCRGFVQSPVKEYGVCSCVVASGILLRRSTGPTHDSSLFPGGKGDISRLCTPLV